MTISDYTPDIPILDFLFGPDFGSHSGKTRLSVIDRYFAGIGPDNRPENSRSNTCGL
ncbi:hypothetical protein [Kiloniella sp.]|uniref:hypothetical protein n=1 Tax=Kiloniella sp. TaxID=1938587 RepID=UPI003A9132C3